MAENWIKPAIFTKSTSARPKNWARTQLFLLLLLQGQENKKLLRVLQLKAEKKLHTSINQPSSACQLLLENYHTYLERQRVLQPKQKQLLQRQLKQNLKVRVEKPREMKCIQRAPSQPEKLLHQHLPVHPAKSADSWVSNYCPVEQNWEDSSKNLFNAKLSWQSQSYSGSCSCN